MEMSEFINYMEGFDEGKNEFDETQMSRELDETQMSSNSEIHTSHKNFKATRATRRKTAIAKSRARLKVLKEIANYDPYDDSIRGIVRKHQLKLVKVGNNLGNSRANKRRDDAAKAKLEVV